MKGTMTNNDEIDNAGRLAPARAGVPGARRKARLIALLATVYAEAGLPEEAADAAARADYVCNFSSRSRGRAGPFLNTGDLCVGATC